MTRGGRQRPPIPLAARSRTAPPGSGQACSCTAGSAAAATSRQTWPHRRTRRPLPADAGPRRGAANPPPIWASRVPPRAVLQPFSGGMEGPLRATAPLQENSQFFPRVILRVNPTRHRGTQKLSHMAISYIFISHRPALLINELAQPLYTNVSTSTLPPAQNNEAAGRPTQKLSQINKLTSPISSLNTSYQLSYSPKLKNLIQTYDLHKYIHDQPSPSLSNRG
jgi:hypothetical protein